MATLTKIATGAAVAAGSPFNGSWTNEQNARVATSDAAAAGSATYATCAPGKNQEFASLWPFVFSEIPAGSAINSCLVKVQWKVSTTSSIAELRSALFADNGAGSPDQASALSAVPGVSRTTEPTADTDDSYTASPSAAQLRQGVWVRVQALRGNTNTSATFSLDYIQVTVNYTPADTLTAGNVDAGAPTLGAPALTEESSGDSLSAANLDAGAPTLGTPALAQAHALAADALAAGAAVFTSATLGQAHALTAVAAAAGAPSLGSPGAAQIHVLEASALDAGTPALDVPALGGEGTDALSAASLDAEAPELGGPVATDPPSEVVDQGSSGGGGGWPFGRPQSTETHAFGALDLVVATPELGRPGLAAVPSAEQARRKRKLMLLLAQ